MNGLITELDVSVVLEQQLYTGALVIVLTMFTQIM